MLNKTIFCITSSLILCCLNGYGQSKEERKVHSKTYRLQQRDSLKKASYPMTDYIAYFQAGFGIENELSRDFVSKLNEEFGAIAQDNLAAGSFGIGIHVYRGIQIGTRYSYLSRNLSLDSANLHFSQTILDYGISYRRIFFKRWLLTGGIYAGMYSMKQTIGVQAGTTTVFEAYSGKTFNMYSVESRFRFIAGVHLDIGYGVNKYAELFLSSAYWVLPGRSQIRVGDVPVSRGSLMLTGGLRFTLNNL